MAEKVGSPLARTATVAVAPAVPLIVQLCSVADRPVQPLAGVPPTSTSWVRLVAPFQLVGAVQPIVAVPFAASVCDTPVGAAGFAVLDST